MIDAGYEKYITPMPNTYSGASKTRTKRTKKTKGKKSTEKKQKKNNEKTS